MAFVYTALAALALAGCAGQAAAQDAGPPPWSTPATGRATLTHYMLPRNSIVACGCTAASTHYPTAAINELAYGSSTGFGPACGRCYRLTLQSTPMAAQPPEGDGREFAPDDRDAPSIVVKVTDLCPSGSSGSNSDWCSASVAPDRGNMLDSMVHFDLAWPSRAIPRDFYPRNSQGGDYGVWWANYEQVDCREWAGWDDARAWGSQWAQQSSACCVPNPSEGGPANTSTAPDDFANNARISRSAQTSECPSYSRLAASVPRAESLYDVLTSAVPNTSNVLTMNAAPKGTSVWLPTVLASTIFATILSFQQ